MTDNFTGGNPMKTETSPKRGGNDRSTSPTPRKQQIPTEESAGTTTSAKNGKKIMRPVKSPKEKAEEIEKPPAPPVKSKSRKEESKYSALGTSADLELGTPLPAATSAEESALAAERKEDHQHHPSPSKPVHRKEKEQSTAIADEDDHRGDFIDQHNKKNEKKNRFKGVNHIQYGLWAHFMAYGAALMCICMGIISMLWTNARAYGCHIDGRIISNVYLYTPSNICPTVYVRPDSGAPVDVCCRFNDVSSLQGELAIGAIYLVYGIFILFIYENTDWGYGLWFPNDTIFYRNRVSVIGCVHLIMGLAGCYNYATCLAGIFLFFTGLVYVHAVNRFEAGDGGRETRRKAREAEKAKKAKNREEKTTSMRLKEQVDYALSFNPITFYTRIYNEDKLSSYIWTGIFVLINFITFVYTLYSWYKIINTMRGGLFHGSLNTTCDDAICHTNRKAVKYGPISYWAAWAKACGMCLNLDGALLLLPVVRMLLRKLHNIGESFSHTQQANDIFGRFFAHPLTRYLPLQKNIDFHKLCAIAIFFFAWAHMIFHWLNLWISNEVTLQFFRFAHWEGTDFFTGGLTALAMFFIYSAAPDSVRLSKYEVFFRAHHFFGLFYLAMFLHGPTFFYWTCVPVLLYLTERYMQLSRGNRPYQLIKVEYIPPVMAIYFRPVFKEDFVFKEGQYLYLNCPFISATEWHPFTISSATDDMMNPVRIHLESGEEVQEVPRPKNWPNTAKWNKYCLVSQDWQSMDPSLYLDKSETAFFDYVTVHVKVHGLEEVQARTWTRKVKEFFESMSPGKKFPFYFSRRDERGEISMGRQYYLDGTTPLLRVDGPHAAPAEHYARYGTLMLIGAGIGLTPCVSILTSLTKYRWKKNFNPELLHFYWIIRQNEIESFQWLVHLLTEMSFEIKKARAANQIDKRYYCEINIYVTGVEKGHKDGQPLYRPKKKLNSALTNVLPTFTADELYEQMLNPTVESKGQIAKMKAVGGKAANRLQDIWIWNGRPNWDEVFKDMKEQRQHADIGVCFCGAPMIGADLKTMCEKYSNVSEDCLFNLHKENF